MGKCYIIIDLHNRDDVHLYVYTYLLVNPIRIRVMEIH